MRRHNRRWEDRDITSRLPVWLQFLITFMAAGLFWGITIYLLLNGIPGGQ